MSPATDQSPFLARHRAGHPGHPGYTRRFDRRSHTHGVVQWLGRNRIAVKSFVLLTAMIVVSNGCRRHPDNTWLPPVCGIPVRETEFVADLRSAGWGVADAGVIELRLPMVEGSVRVGQHDTIEGSGRSVLFLGSSDSHSGEESFVKEGFIRINDGSRPGRFEEFAFLLDLYRLNTENPHFHGEYLLFLRKLAILLRKRDIVMVSYGRVNDSGLKAILLHEKSDPAARIHATFYTRDGRGLAEATFTDDAGDESWIVDACATIRLTERIGSSKTTESE